MHTVAISTNYLINLFRCLCLSKHMIWSYEYVIPFPKVGRFHPIVLIVICDIYFVEMSGQAQQMGGFIIHVLLRILRPPKEPNRSDPSIGLTIWYISICYTKSNLHLHALNPINYPFYGDPIRTYNIYDYKPGQASTWWGIQAPNSTRTTQRQTFFFFFWMKQRQTF